MIVPEAHPFLRVDDRWVFLKKWVHLFVSLATAKSLYGFSAGESPGTGNCGQVGLFLLAFIGVTI